MRILHVSKKNPYPAKDGESIANSNLARCLYEAGQTVDLATLNTNKHYTDPVITTANLPYYDNIHIVPHSLELKFTDALLHLLTDKSYNIERFKSVDFRHALTDILKSNKYSCIILETIYVLPYISLIKELSAAVVILRAHNVENHIWESRAKQESSLAKRTYVSQLAVKLKEYEMKMSKLCDGVICVSDNDADWFRQHLPISNVLYCPIGIPSGLNTKKPKTENLLRFGFIGAMDWDPNVDGVEWFVSKVWPSVMTQFHNATFHLAGRNMPKDWKNRNVNGMVNHGEVDNAQTFLASIDVLIVPLFIASGIRVKIIEAMAMGLVVISTKIGMLGNKAQHNDHVLIANTAHDFIEQMGIAYKDKDTRIRIGTAAQQFAKQHFDERQLTTTVIDFINTQIDKKLSLS